MFCPSFLTIVLLSDVLRGFTWPSFFYVVWVSMVLQIYYCESSSFFFSITSFPAPPPTLPAKSNPCSPFSNIADPRPFYTLNWSPPRILILKGPRHSSIFLFVKSQLIVCLHIVHHLSRWFDPLPILPLLSSSELTRSSLNPLNELLTTASYPLRPITCFLLFPFAPGWGVLFLSVFALPVEWFPSLNPSHRSPVTGLSFNFLLRKALKFPSLGIFEGYLFVFPPFFFRHFFPFFPPLSFNLLSFCKVLAFSVRP